MSNRRAIQAREVAESYLGALGVGLVLALLWLLQGCASGGIPKHASCDETKVAAFTARCKMQVELLCPRDPEIPCEAEMTCERQLCDLCPLAEGCEK